MADFKRMYMTVSVDVVPQGLNLWCGISPDAPDNWLKVTYPHTYTHVSDGCTWIIFSNEALSVNTQATVTEYADKACDHAKRKNDQRRPVNRK